MKYQIITNIPNLPLYWEVSHIAPQATTVEATPLFKDIQKRGRNVALSLLNVTDVERTQAVFPQVTGFTRFDTEANFIQGIADHLGLRKPSGRIQNLPPGKMSMLHIDNLDLGYVNAFEDELRGESFSDDELREFSRNPLSVARVFVMMDDAKPGQIITFGDDVMNTWKKGDVVYWDWTAVVHSTVNTGYWDRPLLRLSGITTEKFNDLLN